MSALWLVPLLVLLLVAGLFMLGRYLQGQAQAGLKRLRSDLRRFQAERRQLEGVASAYSTDDPEPYRSQVGGLRQKLAILQRRSEQLERRHVDLGQQAAVLGHNRLLAILGAPYQWRFLNGQVAALESELAQASLLLAQAQ